jgi:hypothetical protein
MDASILHQQASAAMRQGCVFERLSREMGFSKSVINEAEQHTESKYGRWQHTESRNSRIRRTVKGYVSRSTPNLLPPIPSPSSPPTTHTQAVLQNTTLRRNLAASGGALSLYKRASALLDDSVVEGNVADAAAIVSAAGVGPESANYGNGGGIMVRAPGRIGDGGGAAGPVLAGVGCDEGTRKSGSRELGLCVNPNATRGPTPPLRLPPATSCS